ncbi:MAG: response regulator transcription factor [Anaerolineae bacterium]|nr:response regulator transcription factor [Anaerolineae bacterium]
MTIQIIIADDHPVFRFGLRTLLAAEPDTEVVGEAASGAEAISLADSLQPDLILMDINMPDMNGIEATRLIVQRQPTIAILIITMFEDDTVFAALSAGARGYILKGAEGEETLRAIRAAANGEAIFSPAIAERLARHFAQAPPPTALPFPDLTNREREILVLVAQGLTNSAIAERLALSPKTVRNLVSIIFSKLHVTDRSEAIVKAREAGLGLNH